MFPPGWAITSPSACLTRGTLLVSGVGFGALISGHTIPGSAVFNLSATCQGALGNVLSLESADVKTSSIFPRRVLIGTSSCARVALNSVKRSEIKLSTQGGYDFSKLDVRGFSVL